MSNQQQQQQPHPPGFELLLKSSGLQSLVSSADNKQSLLFQLLIPPVHWSVIRCNQRLVVNDDDDVTTTELLPDNWTTSIKEENGHKCVVLKYKGSDDDGVVSEVKVLEVQVGKVVAVSRDLGGVVLVDVGEVLDIHNGTTDVVRWYKDLWKLEEQVKLKLFGGGAAKKKEEEETHKNDDEHRTDPYASKVKDDQKKKRNDEDEDGDNPNNYYTPQPIRPQRPDPFSVYDPLRIGRSDLDPFGGGVGGGGMLMDPRGFRGGPRLPGGVNPPRFDPFGPFGGRGGGSGGFPGFGGGGGGGAPRMPFGGPDNDLERPPRDLGYDDMFM